jgi:hypothetical protein
MRLPASALNDAEYELRLLVDSISYPVQSIDLEGTVMILEQSSRVLLTGKRIKEQLLGARQNCYHSESDLKSLRSNTTKKGLILRITAPIVTIVLVVVGPSSVLDIFRTSTTPAISESLQLQWFVCS